MSIQFSCHQCGQAFHAPDEYGGGNARCKKCGTIVTVPKKQANTVLPTASLGEGGRQSSHKSPAHVAQSAICSIEVACPNCKQRFPVEFTGEPPKGKQRVACDHCGVEKRLSAFQLELGRQVQEQEEKQRKADEERQKKEAKKKREQEVEELLDDLSSDFMSSERVLPPPPMPVTPTPVVVVPAAEPAAYRTVNSEALGWMLIGTPAIAAFLIWFWVGNMNLFQNPASSLALLVAGTVVITSILMAVDAGQLGIGRIEIEGRRGTSPAGWFFGGLLLWIVCYPAYLHVRRKYGVASRLLLGLVVALVFLGSGGMMSVAIEARKSEVREAFSGVSDSLRDLGDTLSAPTQVSVPTRPTANPTKSFEIADFDMRRTSSNEFIVEVGWKVVLKSKSGERKSYTAHMKFLDNSEFVVSQDIQFGLILGPYETKTFTFETFMTPNEWSQVDQYKVEVREL